MSNRYRLALLDLDGTLWRGGAVIEGAPAFVERLRNMGTQPVFFTNNASRTPEEVVAALHMCGIAAQASEICTSAQAAAHVLKGRIAGKSIVTYTGRSGLQEALTEAGFDARRAQGSALRDKWVTEAAAAIVGIDQDASYMDLALVSRVAYRLGWFILTNADVRLPVEDGFLPGNGSLGALVATASGTTPLVTGKPEATFVEFALERYGVSREDTVIVGDNLYTDILAGANAGVHSIFVKTGVSFPASAEAPIPDETAESVDNIFRQ